MKALGDDDDDEDEFFFCGMVDLRKALVVTSSRDHCQRFSPSQISETPRAEFVPEQNLSSGFAE